MTIIPNPACRREREDTELGLWSPSELPFLYPFLLRASLAETEKLRSTFESDSKSWPEDSPSF